MRNVRSRSITLSARLLEVVVGIALAAGLVFGQVTTGNISGTVRDASGAVVAGAGVTATSRETALVRTVQSGSDGHYKLTSLPVGAYDVKSEAPGFQSQVQQNLNLSVGQEAVLNFTLAVGTVQETLTVTAEAPLVNTSSGILGGLVDEGRVADLPLNGRSFNDLVLLQTGISVHQPVSTTSTTSIGLAFSSNGATIRSNYMSLDGASLTAPLQGITGISLSGLMLGVDAIREFRVLTNSFPAEFGMAMGSQMMIVSKGGTNQLHGSVFEFIRNSALDARNFFSQTNPPFRRNNFGGSLGGHIRKDKDFFFVTYEGLRELLGVPKLLNVPNQLARTNGGLVPQVNPAVIPYLNLYPLPNGVIATDPTGRLGVGRFAYSFNQTTGEDFGQVRLDHNFSERDQLFVRYTMDDTRKIAPQGTNPALFYENQSSRGQFATLSENHTLSPAVLNTARLSYTRPFQTFDRAVSGTESLGFVPGHPVGTIAPGSGVTTIGNGNPLFFGTNSGTFSDDLSWVKDKHTFKFGMLINRYRSFLNTNLNVNGNYIFSNLQQFLVGVPLEFDVLTIGSTTDKTYVWNTFGFYAQDDWRATSRLTLNLGLRYEFHTTINEVTGHGSSVRDIRRDTAATLGTPLWKNSSLSGFGPRLGFAWDVRGDGKTAVRGGFGIYYDIGNLMAAANVHTTGTPPFAVQVFLTQGLGFPTSTPVPAFDAKGLSATLRTIEYDQAQPHLLSYNLTVERQLPGSMMISVGYAGSRGLNLIQTIEDNPTLPQILPGGTEFWPSNAPRANPAWDSCECKTTGGDSWYNSLQVSLQKRLSHNLQFQTSYTFSKLLDTTQGQHGGEAGGSLVTGTDPGHEGTDKGPADFNVPHSLVFNTLYTVPSPNLTGIAGGIAKGWRVGTIFTIKSGLPFTPYLSGNRSRSLVLGGAGNADRPNLLPGRNPGNITLGGPDRYFDPTAFAIQPVGFLGNLGRNTFMGPLHAVWNFSLVKDTPIRFLGEGRRLEFRAEFFNLLNHTDLNIPTSGRTVFTADATRASSAPLSTAGQIGSTIAPAREIQFALKLIF